MPEALKLGDVSHVESKSQVVPASATLIDRYIGDRSRNSPYHHVSHSVTQRTRCVVWSLAAISDAGSSFQRKGSSPENIIVSTNMEQPTYRMLDFDVLVPWYDINQG